MTGPDARPTSTQTVATVTRAEIKKLLRAGGIRGWMIVAVVLGIVSGLIAVLMSGAPSLQEIGGISVADVASSGPVIVALILSLAVTYHVPREVADGTVMTARCLVPRTKILFAGRMIAWCSVAAGLAAVTAVVPLPAGLVVGDVVGSSPLELTGGLLTSVGLATLLVALAHAAATLLKRGAVVVAVGMTMLIVLPLVITLGAFLVAGPLGTALTWLGRVVPGSLLVMALQIPTGSAASWGPWASAVLGLAVWLVVTTGLAYRGFTRPSYGDR